MHYSVREGLLIMKSSNKDILSAFLHNFSAKKIMLGAVNFDKNKLHVFLLMLLPVPKENKEAYNKYKTALRNFWSGCGDIKDYEYVLATREKAKIR